MTIRLLRLIFLTCCAILYTIFTCHLGLITVSAIEIASSASYGLAVFEDSIYFEIIWPESLMYTFKLKQARDFGTVLDKLHENVELIISDPEDACQDLFNDVYGAVVLIRRGECSFLTKSKKAEKAGAIAAIISDNDEANDNTMIEMINDETNRLVHIPAYFLLGKDG
ncbi:hypothetical protein Btru_034556 [Bulinus truncatus]|nr:hypothetical protein Btru_034556 [Bulinus truncatus]